MLRSTCCNEKVFKEYDELICPSCDKVVNPIRELGGWSRQFAVYDDTEAIKQELQELLKELDGMKKADGRGRKTCDCTNHENCGCKVDDYNQALEDVKNLIKKRG